MSFGAHREGGSCFSETISTKADVSRFASSTLQVFVTLLSTEYISMEYLIKQRWPASSQVLTLGQSGFILGEFTFRRAVSALADFTSSPKVLPLVPLSSVLLVICSVASGFTSDRL